MSPRPIIAQRASEFNIAGITSLLGKSYAVATVTMTDVLEKIKGLKNTQNMSQKKSRERSRRPGLIRLSLTTFRITITKQIPMRLLSNQYRVKYHTITEARLMIKLAAYTIEKFPMHYKHPIFSAVAQCYSRLIPSLQSINDASACSINMV